MCVCICIYIIYIWQGETTLTLQVLAYQAGIFDRDIFLVLVVSTLLSINLCCIGTLFLERIYQMLVPIVGPRWLDYPSELERRRELKKHKEFEECQLKNHVVILGFNETGQDVAEYFRMMKKEVFVVDLDPSLHKAFKFAYKGVRGHRVPKCPPIDNLVSAHEYRMQMLEEKKSARNSAKESAIESGFNNGGGHKAPEPEEVANTTTNTRGQEEWGSLLAKPSQESAGRVAEADSQHPPLPGATSASPVEEVQVTGQGFGVQDLPRPARFGSAAEMSRRLQRFTTTRVVGQGFGQDEAAGHEGQPAPTPPAGHARLGSLFGMGDDVAELEAEINGKHLASQYLVDYIVH